ncbi:BlaI/MecI/CopY family transcriptional regulator [Psychroflexus montanilacus]|uniref:BlaI/MecI/CopY family transcriptional regulator n=1 Tax=Psychroflexus montanilacus TaxID=2873598 RepID=UPI001CCA29BE|nr:BlaI/MecI/CopY family transcriptional regulator [Psychroflexus montanilacus]MBZ9652470.1 BlaI/MecI/CopY family transcriptional regulator [Psychroflexus montanilacus]
MRQLTRAEEEVMQLLWKKGKSRVAEIIEDMPEPKPAYNTTSTIVRILEDKGFVGHEKVGRGFKYFALVDKDTYQKATMKKMVNSYFEGSFKNMVSFFVKEKNMSTKDLESILKELDKNEE